MSMAVARTSAHFRSSAAGTHADNPAPRMAGTHAVRLRGEQAGLLTQGHSRQIRQSVRALLVVWSVNVCLGGTCRYDVVVAAALSEFHLRCCPCSTGT
jgi:hypothetical protein